MSFFVDQQGALGLRAVEDKAILAALEMQRQAGVSVFTDGEYRRGSWQSDMADSVDGFVPEHLPIEPGLTQEEDLSVARISSAMSAAGGVASRAADILRVSRSTFYKACKRLNIQPEALRET